MDRYLRARPTPAGLAGAAVAQRGQPGTADGQRDLPGGHPPGRQCGVDVWPHRSWHHFSHTWLERGGPEGDLMELNSWSSPQMLASYGASARRTYDRIMTDSP